MPHLTVKTGLGEVIFREISGTFDVGRSSDCDLQIDSRLLSRRHLRLEKSSEGWRAVDLASTNGTRVRGQKIAIHLLQNGDELQLDDATLWFNLNVPNPQEPPLLDAASPPYETADLADALPEHEIDAILSRVGSDSVDEEPPASAMFEDISTALSEETPLKSASAASQPMPRRADTASLWAIAMKQAASSPATKDATQKLIEARPSQTQKRSLSVPPRGWNWKALALRFEYDPKFKGAVTVATVALLLVGGYFWLGANGFVQTHGANAGPASSSAHVQAPASQNSRNAAADLPV